MAFAFSTSVESTGGWQVQPYAGDGEGTPTPQAVFAQMLDVEHRDTPLGLELGRVERAEVITIGDGRAVLVDTGDILRDSPASTRDTAETEPPTLELQKSTLRGHEVRGLLDAPAPRELDIVDRSNRIEAHRVAEVIEIAAHLRTLVEGPTTIGDPTEPGPPDLADTEDPLASRTPPESFGPYVLVGPLGDGANDMLVQLARDTRGQDAEQVVVLERVRPKTTSLFNLVPDRERAEGAANVHLSHPNLVSVIDHGVRDGQPFIVRELVDGMSLRALGILSPNGVDLRAVLAIGEQVLSALAYGTRQLDEGLPLGLLHGAISPSAILVERTGRVKLTPLTVMSVDGVPLSPRDGGRRGARGYMAPEQFEGLVADRRADLFSLALVLVELLSGAPLGDGGAKELGDVPRDIRVRCERAGAPRGVVEMFVAMASIDPDHRPESTDELRGVMLDHLRAAGGDPSLEVVLSTAFARVSPKRSQPRRAPSDLLPMRPRGGRRSAAPKRRQPELQPVGLSDAEIGHLLRGGALCMVSLLLLFLAMLSRV